MIKLIKHNNNATEILNQTTPAQSIFFSYETPVAGLDEKGYFKTDKKYSMTTTKHINKWLIKNNATNARVVKQSFIDELLNI